MKILSNQFYCIICGESWDWELHTWLSIHSENLTNKFWEKWEGYSRKSCRMRLKFSSFRWDWWSIRFGRNGDFHKSKSLLSLMNLQLKLKVIGILAQTLMNFSLKFQKIWEKWSVFYEIILIRFFKKIPNFFEISWIVIFQLSLSNRHQKYSLTVDLFWILRKEFLNLYECCPKRMK